MWLSGRPGQVSNAQAGDRQAAQSGDAVTGDDVLRFDTVLRQPTGQHHAPARVAPLEEQSLVLERLRIQP